MSHLFYNTWTCSVLWSTRRAYHSARWMFNSKLFQFAPPAQEEPPGEWNLHVWQLHMQRSAFVHLLLIGAAQSFIISMHLIINLLLPMLEKYISKNIWMCGSYLNGCYTHIQKVSLWYPFFKAEKVTERSFQLFGDHYRIVLFCFNSWNRNENSEQKRVVISFRISGNNMTALSYEIQSQQIHDWHVENAHKFAFRHSKSCVRKWFQRPQLIYMSCYNTLNVSFHHIYSFNIANKELIKQRRELHRT